MKCEKFEHSNALPNEPEDCWFCKHWKYWESPNICMLPEQEKERQRIIAGRHKNQTRLTE